MQTLIGIIVSNVFVLVCIGISTLFEKKKWMSGEGTRKFVHIAVSNWWFIAMYYFDTAITAAIVPVMFVIVNYYSYKKQLFTSIERGGGVKDLGTVYYAIALVVLSLWSFGMGRPEIGGIGILIMGYADGFAAVVGTKFGKTPLIHGKSVEGTLTAVIMATVVVMGFNAVYGLGLSSAQMIIIAISATLFELFTPLGLDNLTVPIGSSLIAYAFL